jgi:hypothetical protein
MTSQSTPETKIFVVTIATSSSLSQVHPAFHQSQAQEEHMDVKFIRFYYCSTIAIYLPFLMF